MRYLSLKQVLRLYYRIMAKSGGAAGVRDLGGVEAALAQPRMSFGGQDLYPTLVDKAATLGFSLVMNHPFLDGNKRIGHAAVEAFLLMNEAEIVAPTDEQESVILSLAAGDLSHEQFRLWLETHVRDRREVDWIRTRGVIE
jgi:death on curing protein